MLGSYAQPFMSNPLTQKSRTIPEFNTVELARCKKIHHIAIDERHLCKVKGYPAVFLSDQLFDCFHVSRLHPSTHA